MVSSGWEGEKKGTWVAIEAIEIRGKTKKVPRDGEGGVHPGRGGGVVALTQARDNE